MDATRNRAKSIFLDAVENCPPEGWDRYLDEACGDDADLRRRVRILLDAHQQADSFVEEPGPAATVAADAAEEPGAVVGPYRLREVLGEGGMGVVYVAEQAEPVRRRVALKVIRPGMDTRQVIARFEAERQALALMDHPNIARVFDAGTTPAGRPYFVMELVRGLPITAYCDREQLTIPDRLELFALVCRAVQHAHQKGVIHRDLKPSNVLVTVVDGVAVPKVIDFGVAKATGASLTERTLYTGFHQLVGTPLYMSPEQADLAGVDVDTRSDVYSLGVLLYELLTGTTPFDPETLRKAAFDEMRRIIREEEPPRPSTRLSALDADRTESTARLRSATRRLDRTVRGELDWVVMKALEKDRSRRYETASDFAADVMNYLTDRPVEACPPSVWYRFAKYARRNRAVLLTAALVGLTLVAGTAVSVWQSVRATRAGTLATQREQEARDSAAESKAVLRFFVKDVLGSAAPENALGRDLKVSEALAEAEKALDTAFSDQPLVEAAVRRSLAWTYGTLGRYDLARRHSARALELRRRLLGPEHLNTLGSIEMEAALCVRSGKLDEARTMFEEVVQGRQRVLGPDHPDTLEAMGSLAVVLDRLGRSGDAGRLFEQVLEARRRVLGPEHRSTLTAMHNVAVWYSVVKRFDEARGRHEELLEVRRRVLGPEHPDTLHSMCSLATTLLEMGRVEAAHALFERTLETQRRVLGPEHPDTLASMKDLATGHCLLGHHGEARAFLEQALAVQRRTLGAAHPDTLETKKGLAQLLHAQGRDEEARVLLEEVLEAQRRVPGADNPVTLDSMAWLAAVLHAQGKFAEATRLKAETLEARWRVLGPESPVTRSNLEMLVEWLAVSPVATPGDLSQALEFARKAVERDPTHEMAWQSLGWLLYRLGDWKGSLESLEKTSRGGGDFILAMAFWRLGEEDQARAVFEREDAWLKGYEPRWDERKRKGVPTTPTPTTLRLLRAEAAALMGIDPSEPESKTAPEPARPRK